MADAEPWYVYMLRCCDGSLYVGIAQDLAARTKQHNNGYGADYTARRRPVRLVWREQCASKSAARRRELQTKGWRREKKEALTRGFPSTSSG